MTAETDTETTQYTLTDEPTDKQRERPRTFVQCPECDAWLLRSERHDHPHAVFRGDYTGFVRSLDTDGDDEPPEGERASDPSPEPIGQWWTVWLSYSVEYRFTVPGYTKHDAAQIAKAMAWDASPDDQFHVHTEYEPGKEIYEIDEGVVEELETLERAP